MKFIGAAIFLLALNWTWSLALSEPTIDAQTHVQIQQELRSIIEQVIAQHRPTAKAVKFQSLWTEELSKTQVKAHFIYSFDDEDESGDVVEQSEEGFVILNRLSDPNDPAANGWSLDEVTVSQEVINFKTSIVIEPKAN